MSPSPGTLPRVARPGALQIVAETAHLLRAAPAATWLCALVGTVPCAAAFLFFWTDMSSGALAGQRLPAAAFGMAILFIWMKCWQSVFAARLRAQLVGGGAPRWTVGRVARLAAAQTTHQTWLLFVFPFAAASLIFFPFVNGLAQNLTVLGDGAESKAGQSGPLRRALTQSRRGAAGGDLTLTWLFSPWLLLFAALCLVAVWAIMDRTESVGLRSAVPLLSIPIVALLFCPFVLATAVNVASALAALPWLARTLFGMEGAFMQSGAAGFLNTTFLAAVCALTYLCLDPVLKGAYVVQCFHGESRTTGEDLLADFRRAGRKATLGAAALLAAAFAFLPSNAFAQAPAGETNGLDAERLDRSIDDVFRDPVFSWRAPREWNLPDLKMPDLEAPDLPEANLSFFEKIGRALRNFLRGIGNFLDKIFAEIDDFLDWFGGLFDPPDVDLPTPSGSAPSGAGVRLLAVVLLAAALCALIALAAREALKGRRGRKTEARAEKAPAAVPDPEDESVTADALPHDEWIAMATDFAAKGDYRRALRALFLGQIAYLGQCGLVRLRRSKSNRDYQRELETRAHVAPELPGMFLQSRLAFDAVWYGRREAARETFEAFQNGYERMRGIAR